MFVVGVVGVSTGDSDDIDSETKSVLSVFILMLFLINGCRNALFRHLRTLPNFTIKHESINGEIDQLFNERDV